jgi:hypothetical protein
LTIFKNFSFDSSYVLIQTILNKKSKIFENNSCLVYLMNTVLTEPGHTMYAYLTLQRGDLNFAAVSVLRYLFSPTFKFYSRITLLIIMFKVYEI